MPSIYTFNPVYALFHNPYEAGTFEADIARFSRLIHGTLRPLPEVWPYIPKKKGEVARGRPTIAQLRAMVETSKWVSVDIETAPETSREPWTGKDPTRARLKIIGFGRPDLGLSYDWETLTGKGKAYIKWVLGSNDIVKVLHNGEWFDNRVLRRYGMPVRNWVDTRDLRRSLSNTSRLSLRYNTSIYTDAFNWKDDGDEGDAKGIIFTTDRKKLMQYNAYDCAFTARIYVGMLKDRREVAPDYKPQVVRLYQVHRDLSCIAAEMHQTGLHMRQDMRFFLVRCLDQEIAEKSRIFLDMVGQDAMRCTHNDMRALIYRRHRKAGIKSFDLPDPIDKNMYTNDTLDTISVDQASLLLLLVGGGCPPELIRIIDAFWEVETAKKRRSYLASDLLDQATGPDGRLRPGWNSCGTDTMRFSCSEPNVMNIEQILRHILGPEEGMVWVHADKSQLELRVMEVVADDPVLHKALQTGDVYSFDARQWFGIPDEVDVKKMKPKARKSAKIIHLARQYRASLKAVYGQALMEDRTFTFDAARLLTSRFDATYTGTVQYWEDELEGAYERGYSEGRILGGRHFYPAPPEPSEAANKPIQRTAAEMMNLELIELHSRLRTECPGAKVIIQLHDAFDVECPEKYEAKVSRIMTEVMSRNWTICGRTRPFPIEMKVARRREEPFSTWAEV